MSRNRALRIFTALGCAGLLLASLVPQVASAAPLGPRLEIRAASDDLVIDKFGRSVYLDLGLYLAALDEPFEIQVHRDSYNDPVEVDQMLRGDDGTTAVRSLPPTVLGERPGGFPEFFKVRVVRRTGEVMGTLTPSLCPSDFDRQRVNDEGPNTTVYPAICDANVFFTGIVWGIEEGWAIPMSDSGGWSMKLPQGRYRARVSIDDEYQQILQLPPTPPVKIKFTVSRSDGCFKCLEPHDRKVQGGSLTAEGSAGVPDMPNPDDSVLPDLVSLPAWGIGLHGRNDRKRLSFGATVWTAGAQSLVVEGYRRSNEETMDAYQYFYEDDEPVGRAPVGEFGFDARRGHHHWHFLQFARYSLLGADKSEVLRSKKESFCLAATDAIDLLLPGAEWSPYNTNLATACGQSNSLWIREVLPLGWGDTYFQFTPGQSFNVTDLPNGKYFIAVEANPEGLLHEQRSGNNTRLRKIYLRGTPEERRVVIPPWHGIDSEGGSFGGGGLG